MSRWEENIRKVIPYTPGEQPNQPDMIKLNTNENPYPPAPGVEKALREMDTDTRDFIRILQQENWYMPLQRITG